MQPTLQTKSIFASKTAVVNGLIMLSTLWPPVGNLVKAHPELTLLAVPALNVALRMITKDRVVLFND